MEDVERVSSFRPKGMGAVFVGKTFTVGDGMSTELSKSKSDPSRNTIFHLI